MTLEQQDLFPGWLWQNPSRDPRQGSPSPSSSPVAVRGVLGAVRADPSSHPTVPSLPSVLPAQWHHHKSPTQQPGTLLTGGDKVGALQHPTADGHKTPAFPSPYLCEGLDPKGIALSHLVQVQHRPGSRQRKRESSSPLAYPQPPLQPHVRDLDGTGHHSTAPCRDTAWGGTRSERERDLCLIYHPNFSFSGGAKKHQGMLPFHRKSLCVQERSLQPHHCNCAHNLSSGGLKTPLLEGIWV